MGTINKDTYKRLLVLAVVASFGKDGVIDTQLQQIIYELTKNDKKKPFSYYDDKKL